MAIKHFTGDVEASSIRALSPDPPSAAVVEIIEAVRSGGDAALRELAVRFGEEPAQLRVPSEEIAAAPAALDPELLAALELAITNVRTVARESRSDQQSVSLEQGQSVGYRLIPVDRAAAYVPGGRGSYPSTAVMCLATAVEAGVGEVAVFSPPRESGHVDTAVLAVCALLGVSEVYALGGAQAIAAAALGTESIAAVDVVVGPGNAYVQEAKRQLTGRIGIDSVAGPSELVVVADAVDDVEAIALDLLAQGEHGPDSLVVLISPSSDLLAAVEQRCAEIGAQLALVEAESLENATELADRIAPEHLQLTLDDAQAEQLAPLVKRAGALFIGRNAATAFGDYVTGSNHVLPTGGSARFASALSVATFTRKMAEIKIPDAAVDELASAGATIARGEGFEQHAKSMEARRK